MSLGGRACVYESIKGKKVGEGHKQKAKENIWWHPIGRKRDIGSNTSHGCKENGRKKRKEIIERKEKKGKKRKERVEGWESNKGKGLQVKGILEIWVKDDNIVGRKEEEGRRRRWNGEAGGGGEEVEEQGNVGEEEGRSSRGGGGGKGSNESQYPMRIDGRMSDRR